MEVLKRSFSRNLPKVLRRFPKVKRAVRLARNIVISTGKPKIFCIGRNKTGTTSLVRGLRELGFVICDSAAPRLLMEDWKQRNFHPIIQFCRTAEVFNDQPFSLPFTFQALDQAYPASKFILTVRNDAEQWYQSVVRYMSKRYGCGAPPTINQLREAKYVYTGWMAETYPCAHGVPEDDLFNHGILTAHYESYISTVREYFRYRPADFLEINVADPNAWQMMCRFLDVTSNRAEFPWENRT